MSNWLLGRQEIADYARVSVWTVTAMIKAGLKIYNEPKKGIEPRTTKEDVDNFFKQHSNFVAREWHKPNVRCRNI